MKIGIDSKRIFSNRTGLGVYGRNLVYGLSKLKSAHEYFLYSPNQSDEYLDKQLLSSNFFIRTSKFISSYFWRTFSIKKDLQEDKIDIYHGISNELPIGIEKSRVKTIIDIHDLCFVHFKADYSWFDQQVFWFKARRAAKYSNLIVATSQATKKDIVHYFDVPAEKVEVVYQCCDHSFYNSLAPTSIENVQAKYGLPKEYVLCVGTIQGRKNQKAIIKAMAKIPKKDQVSIVLVGQGKKYLDETILLSKNLGIDMLILNNVSFADLPAVYQGARLFVYPSIVEGFGIPVLEAMASQTPVITSKATSMAEIIQNEECLVNPKDIKGLSHKMHEFLQSDNTSRIKKAHLRSLEFSQEIFAKQIKSLYESI